MRGIVAGLAFAATMALSGCDTAAPLTSEVVKHQRVADYLTIDIDFQGDPHVGLIESMTKEILRERAKALQAGELDHLKNAAVNFWIVIDGDRTPLANFGFAGSALADLAPSSASADVIAAASNVRARPPRGDLLIAEECVTSAAEIKSSALCVDAAL